MLSILTHVLGYTSIVNSHDLTKPCKTSPQCFYKLRIINHELLNEFQSSELVIHAQLNTHVLDTERYNDRDCKYSFPHNAI